MVIATESERMKRETVIYPAVRTIFCFKATRTSRLVPIQLGFYGI